MFACLNSGNNDRAVCLIIVVVQPPQVCQGFVQLPSFVGVTFNFLLVTCNKLLLHYLDAEIIIIIEILLQETEVND